jgi:hypothetical protein
MVCDKDSCEAEIVESERVACVDNEYRGAVGRYAGVCDEGHLVTWDYVEGV